MADIYVYVVADKQVPPETTSKLGNGVYIDRSGSQVTGVEVLNAHRVTVDGKDIVAQLHEAMGGLRNCNQAYDQLRARVAELTEALTEISKTDCEDSNVAEGDCRELYPIRHDFWCNPCIARAALAAGAATAEESRDA